MQARQPSMTVKFMFTKFTKFTKFIKFTPMTQALHNAVHRRSLTHELNNEKYRAIEDSACTTETSA